MDFPSEKTLKKYLKDHPDADRSKHKVVRFDPKDSETHPVRLHQKRKDEEQMEKIRKHYKKKPGDKLTNDEIEKYNNRKKSNVIATELLKVAKLLTAYGEEQED